MEWRSININRNMIEHDTGRAVLVKMPSKSRFKGFKFWHPAKLVREGRHSAALKLSYGDEFEFRLIRGDLKETITVEEFEEAFEVVNSNIREKDDSSYLHVVEPKKLDTVDAEVRDELRN